MSLASAPVRPTLDSSVYRAILHPTISRLLYNPGDEPVEFQMAARTFTVPAFDQMAPKAAWGVREDQDYPPTARKGVLPLRDFHGNKKVVGLQGDVIYEVLSATDQARFAVGEDGASGFVGRRGIRLLSGDDPELDKAIMDDAHEGWKESIYFADCTIVRAHEAINQKRQETGTPLVPPSDRVKKAMRRKADYEAEGRATMEFACPKCAWPFPNAQERDGHIVGMHPDVAAATGIGRTSQFDLDGNLVQVNAAANLKAGPTGAVGGYRLVKTDAMGKVVAEEWVGETPEDAMQRMAARVGASQNSTALALDPILEQMARMEIQMEALQARLAASEQARQAAGEGVPVPLSAMPGQELSNLNVLSDEPEAKTEEPPKVPEKTATRAAKKEK